MRSRALTRTARTAVAGAALVALVLSATACNPGRPPAVTVGGTDISAEHVDSLLRAFGAGSDDARSFARGEGDDTYDSGLAANVLTFLISQVVASDEAEARGLVTERTDAEASDDEGTARDYLIGQLGGEADEQNGNGEAVLDALDDETAEWLLGLVANRLALGRDVGSGADDLIALAQEQYDAQAPTGVFDTVCLRIIVVPPDQVDAVSARLDTGEDFGDVSADVSVIPEVVEARGVNPCIPRANLASPDAVPEAVQLLEAAPGDVIGPSPYTEDDGTEYAALLERGEAQTTPFEEVQEQIIAQLEQSGAGADDGGEAEVTQLVQDALDADAPRIDPRFGTWDPGSDGLGGQVVPPEGARLPDGEG